MCPCESGSVYARCCGVYLESEQSPETAEQLMRSRYTAYVRQREDYLLKTWHPRTRPQAVEFETATRWLGLKILKSESGGASDHEGVVEFVARYKIGGRAYRMQEQSCFVREGHTWFYVEARQ